MARKTMYEIIQELQPLVDELKKELESKWCKAVTIDDRAVVFWWDHKESPTMQDVCDITEWYAEEIECWGPCSEKELEHIRRLKLSREEVSEY